MDAVAASDHRGEFMLDGPRGNGSPEFLKILQQDVGRFAHLHGKRGVEQIG